MEWISVKEKMPKEYTDVLILNKYKNYEKKTSFMIFTAYWDDLNRVFRSNITGLFTRFLPDEFWHMAEFKKKEITHWMPLPELPKEDYGDR